MLFRSPSIHGPGYTTAVNHLTLFDTPPSCAGAHVARARASASFFLNCVACGAQIHVVLIGLFQNKIWL